MIPREASQEVTKLTKSFRVTAVTGPRQSGKTTLLKNDFEKYAYYNLEDLNTLQFYDATAPAGEQGFTRILVTEPEHPYVANWWPTGHMLGYEHGFVHQAKDFIEAIAAGTQPSPSFRDGAQVQRVLAAVESSAGNGSAWTQV